MTSTAVSSRTLEHLYRIEFSALRRGSFESVPDLERTIYEFVAPSNGSARPFIWTVTADRILRKIKRRKLVAETRH